MYNNERILGIIPARGGSKGIPHKNIIDLCGKPLLGWTISAAINSDYIDYVLVSTDDNDIRDTAIRFGAQVPFLRSEDIAGDHAKTIDCVVEAVNRLSDTGEIFDTVVLLQPTSPLRNEHHIDEAIRLFYEKGKSGLVSVKPVEDHPVLIRHIDDSGRLVNLLPGSSTVRRQDMPDYFIVNGAIYINSFSEITPDLSFNDNPIPYIMSPEASVDIDTTSDLKSAELIITGQT